MLSIILNRKYKMQRLTIIIFFLILSTTLIAQSPHGDELKISCSECHNPNGWKMVEGTFTFTHSSTDFPLVGQHQSISCKACHNDLIFSKAQTDCISCHTDIHEQTVGNECSRCHTPQSWLVENTTQLHEQSRFPLLGAHATADCFQCHESASLLRFDPLSIDCFDCHQTDYQAAKEPDHVAGNFSTDCAECHAMNAFEWKGAGISHLFFPLTQGHEISDCFACHVQGQNYNSISQECVSCHQSDYNSTINPDHQASGFSTDCSQCHSTSPGWKPAKMTDHDGQYYPIYSGKHEGEWNNCNECHTTSGNYGLFSCIDCHEHNQSDMNSEHNDVGGYSWNSNACFECHPQGDGEGSFNHSQSNFPLTGAHLTTDCSQCHATGYTGTTTACGDCHLVDFNQTTNPNHTELGLAVSCETCHTTESGWTPATMDNHNDYFVLNGAHITTDCFACHEGNYTATPNLCFGCHADNYNETTNPPHIASQFNTECETCHSETAWTPATFDHDAEFFPIYSGSHAGEWTNCIECHTTPNNYTLFSCIDCHDHNQTDMADEHNGISGYSWNSNACLECHPNGDGEGFNHATSNFPLTGAHLTVDCIGCHESGYSGTTTVCAGCHTDNYNQATNPNHIQNGISTNCESCHTTEAGWAPATFAIHNDFYALTGAHSAIQNDCFTCHEGNYNNTPNACSGCHTPDYAQATNPNHQQLGIPTTCETCHTTVSGWAPATFPTHNDYYVLTGAHASISTSCFECHSGNYTNTPNTCYGCHQDDFNQTNDPDHQVAQFPTACEDCHSQSAWEPSTFDHDGQYFPIYSGQHDGEWTTCIECHTNPTNYAVFSCIDCHEHNQAEMASEHNGVSGYQWNSNACLDCHPNGDGDKGKLNKVSREN
jgi:hypothetical protein